MGRLRVETLERVEAYSDRVLDVAEALERDGRWRRIVDQLVGSGGSVGANISEADQAMSSKDFLKCLGTVNKELNETKFWLRRVARRGWIKPARLQPLLRDTDEWLSIFNRMIVKTRVNERAKTKPRRRTGGV